MGLHSCYVYVGIARMVLREMRQKDGIQESICESVFLLPQFRGGWI